MKGKGMDRSRSDGEKSSQDWRIEEMERSSIERQEKEEEHN